MLRAVIGLLVLALMPRLFPGEPIVRITTTEKVQAFTAEEFAALPHVEVRTLEPHEKVERTYRGVSMRQLLALAGAPLGDKLRGPALSLGVLIRCKDQYTVLFALAEFDENFSARTILLADQEDGKPPPATAAPLRLVAPGDQRGARWARMVTAIEVVSLGNR